MPDRPTPPLSPDPRAASASPARPPVRRAVFEDVALSVAESARRPVATSGRTARRGARVQAPHEAVQMGNPFADDGRDGASSPVPKPVAPQSGAQEPVFQEPSLQYDEASGFRIDYGSEGAPASTALTRVERSRPTPAPVGAYASGPPAPPVPPRASGRYAARDKARMLRRHKGLVVGLTLLGLLAGWLLSELTATTYEAYSILLVNPPQQGDGALNSGFVNAPGDDDRKTLNQALILQEAGGIAEATTEAILARTDARSLSVVRNAESRYGAATPETVAQYLQEKVVQVGPAGEQVDAIRVEATAESAHEAHFVASVYTDEYLDLSQSTNRARLTATREILEEQLARRQGELSEVEQQLASTMTSRNAAGLAAQTSATVGQIGSLQSQLDAARGEIQERSARLAALQADLATVDDRLARSATATAQASPVQTQALDADIAELEALLNNVYLQNPELRADPRSHPDVRRMVDRLATLQREREALASQQAGAAVASGGLDVSSAGANGPAYLAQLQSQISQERAALRGANARASTLASRLGQARGQLRGVPAAQVELGQIERQQAASAATVQRLADELERVRLAEDTELGVAQVIREVQMPSKPASQSLPVHLALGGLLGLLLGLAGAAARYRTDARVHTPDDLEEHGFSVVGTIPDLGAVASDDRHDTGAAAVDPSLVTITNPFSPQAETFRHLHANLYAGGHAPAVVLVTAPESATGKSTVATNLAVAAAQAGRRVLLVDADLRKPTVAGLLGLGEHPALGEGPEGTNLVYWSTSIPSLFAMTPRETAESPDEMWAPHQIGELLANLRTAFDLVLVDAPPALHAADAALLAPHADAALLVADAGTSDLDALSQVATELAGVGLTQIGAVLNRFDARNAVGFAKTAGVRHTFVRRV